MDNQKEPINSFDGLFAAGNIFTSRSTSSVSSASENEYEFCDLDIECEGIMNDVRSEI